MNQTIQKGWFKPQSAAEYTDFSLSAIEKALRLGHLKHRRVKFDGQRVSVRIKREWLDQWLEKQPED